MLDAGYEVIPVNPTGAEICGIKSNVSLQEIKKAVDTLTVYVNPDRLKTLLPEIIALKPRRVILNPGTEDDFTKEKLEENGISVEKACTLVLLRTGAF